MEKIRCKSHKNMLLCIPHYLGFRWRSTPFIFLKILILTSGISAAHTQETIDRCVQLILQFYWKMIEQIHLNRKTFCQHWNLNPWPSDSSLVAIALPVIQGFASSFFVPVSILHQVLRDTNQRSLQPLLLSPATFLRAWASKGFGVPLLHLRPWSTRII